MPSIADVLATAHTWRGGDGPYTIAPVVGLLLSILLIRAVLRLPVGVVAAALSVALGPLFATVGGRLGYTVTISAWVLAAVLVRAVLRGVPGSFGRNTPD